MFLCIIIICTVLPSWQIKIYRVGQKKRGNRLITIILSNFNRFTQFFTERFMINLQLKAYLKSHRTLHMLLHYLVKH